MNVTVAAYAVCGPGVPDRERAVALLKGALPYDPALVRDPSPVALPPNERRRLPATARLAMGIGCEALDAAGIDARDVATVFASCGSDGQITHQICEALAKPVPEISPTRFHNSVHNAPAGYWSIAFASHAPSTSLCAHEGSFAAGLVEAATQASLGRRPVLLVAYDVPYPAPLSAVWDAGSGFAAGMVLEPVARREGDRAITVALADEPPSPWPLPLPSALARNPAAHALVLVALLAGLTERVVLPYHRLATVAVSV